MMTPAPDAIECPVALDADGRLAESVTCAHCGYDLRGISLSGQCPECGTALAESLRAELLRYADARWVIGLLWGLVLLGLAPVIWMVTGPFAGGVIGLLACMAALLVGGWLLTRRDPAITERTHADATRRFLRAMSIGLVIVTLVAVQTLDGSTGDGLGWWRWVFLVTLVQAIATLTIALPLHARSLSVRLYPPDVVAGFRLLFRWYPWLVGSLPIAWGLTWFGVSDTGVDPSSWLLVVRVVAMGLSLVACLLLALVVGLSYFFAMLSFARALRTEERLARRRRSLRKGDSA